MISSIVNKFLYPYPNPPHYSPTTHPNHLIWIPNSGTLPPIPCLYFQSSSSKTRPLIIWSHGNACDIGTMAEMLYFLSRNLNINILAYEYPGYGLCVGGTPSEESINHHTRQAYNFVRNIMQYPSDRIVFYGHSIGSGTACMMVSSLIQNGHFVGGLILQSPFKSLTELIKDKVGFFGHFIPTIGWNNLETMRTITCPVLIMHGKQDDLIPAEDSIALHAACVSNKKHIALFDGANHNLIDRRDIFHHLQAFLDTYIHASNSTYANEAIHLDPKYRMVPRYVQQY